MSIEKIMNIGSDHKMTAGFGRVGSAIGNGILAGMVGTAVMTVAQMIEMKISDRKPSTAPIEAVSKVFPVKPAGKEKKAELSQEIHWMYGTLWGAVRGLLSVAGLKNWAGILIHFGAIWMTALIMLPRLKVSPPVSEWGGKAIAKDALLHGLYAMSTGLVYHAIDYANEHQPNE